MSSQTTIRGIDLTKFLMAIVIVSIHVQISQIVGDFYVTFQNCAVPVFFVFSSYFFFKKMRKTSGRELWKGLWNYEKRINKLYLFWLVVLSPAILRWWHKEYLELPIGQAIGAFIKNYFFAYEFGASWFLGALIVGIPIVLLLTRWLNDKVVWIIPFIIYTYICKCPDGYLFELYESYLRTPQLSFPYALWWLVLGHLLSNESIDKYIKRINIYISAAIFIASLLIGILFENFEFVTRSISVIAIFALAINMKLKDYPMLYTRLRTYSIHFYCLHFSLILALGHFFWDNTLLMFILTLIICLIVSETIIRLQDKPLFKWLKYSK